MKKIIPFFLSIIILSACSQETKEDNIDFGTQNGDFKEFKIAAKQFAFEPEAIEVSIGDKVRLIATSTDVPHGFAILEYGINERLNPGEHVTIEFTADNEGIFTFFCSTFCGSGHSGMRGKIIVK